MVVQLVIEKKKKKKAECETAFAPLPIICICYMASLTVAQAAVQKKMTKTEWFRDECISLACFNHHKNTVFCLEKSYNGYADTVWTDGSKAARKVLAGVHSVLILYYRHCIWQAGSSLMHLKASQESLKSNWHPVPNSLHFSSKSSALCDKRELRFWGHHKRVNATSQTRSLNHIVDIRCAKKSRVRTC